MWAACRGGQGMFGGGSPLLPFAGGYAEQPAALMEAFAVCDGALAALEAEERRNKTQD